MKSYESSTYLPLVKKDLKKLIRVPATLFMAILFPILIIGAFGLSFGAIGTGSGNQTYKVGIVDLDTTKWSIYFQGNVSENEVLKNETYQTIDSAQDDLEEGKIDAYIILPYNFGISCNSYWANPANHTAWTNVTVDLYVDQGSMIVTNALPPLIQQILVITLYGEQSVGSQGSVAIGTPTKVEAEHFTQFDLMLPGMFAFTVIFLTMLVAEGFTEDRIQGILKRIQVTPTCLSEVVLSNVIAYMITAIIQIVIVFLAAGIMGFNPQGGIEGIILAFVMVLLLALCNIGFGLIVASISKNTGTATGISFFFILPQMMLGTFVPVPETLSRLVPSYYVTDTLTSVLLRGASVTSQSVIFDLGIIATFCVGVIIVGIYIFAKFGRID